MSESDTDWIERCLDGHPEDYRHLVEHYQGAVVSYVRGRAGGGCDAEEAAQEAFVRAFFALPSLKKRGSFLSWILGIARRVAGEERRARRRAERVAAEAALRKARAGRADRYDAALERAIARLPESYRDVILLRYYTGLSCAEVSGRLGVPLGTVTKYLSRAYALLRRSPELTAEREDREDVEVIR